jgi:hypothetical protein
MMSFESTGSFQKLEKFLRQMSRGELFDTLDKYGAIGVDALASATPVDSGLTANSWAYKIVKQRGTYSIEWYNTNVVSGIPVAILIQYGHGTGTGGWVAGRDYINPAIQPVFDAMTDELWEKVKNG